MLQDRAEGVGSSWIILWDPAWEGILPVVKLRKVEVLEDFDQWAVNS